MLEKVTSERTSMLVIRLALIVNAIFTFIFAFTYLPSLFDLFGLLDNPTGLEGADDFRIVIGALAGAFLVIVTDASFVAWNMLRNREGVSTEQMATARSAKSWSLYGSLAASVAQIVLGQQLVKVPSGIVYAISIVGVGLAGALAILHVYWWDKYRSESFAMKELEERAADTAEEGTFERARQKARMELERTKRERLHAIELEQMEGEIELELERAQAEADIRRELVRERIKHRRQVAKQTQENLRRKVHESAARIADRQAREEERTFLGELGFLDMNLDLSENGHEG